MDLAVHLEKKMNEKVKVLARLFSYRGIVGINVYSNFVIELYAIRKESFNYMVRKIE